MDLTIPYVKEIKFNTKIKEISSISLEHTIKNTEGELTGNFIVSGEYKTHELSVNKEPFSYDLPFNVALSDLIDEDTVEFNITDFYYEILHDETLKVNIECRVIGSTKEVEERENVFEEVKEETEELTDLVSEEMKARIDEQLSEIKEERSEIIEIDEPLVKEEKERINDNEKMDILKTVEKKDDEFITYHVHIVSNGETIESICEKYNTVISSVSEINNINNLQVGDKLIIPDEKNS